MARRFVIAPVIGSGTHFDPFRAGTTGTREPGQPKEDDWRSSSTIPTGPDGMPLHDWCLVMVEHENPGRVQAALAKQGVEPLADIGPDGLIADLPAQARTALANAMQNRGIDIARAQTFSDVLALIRNKLREP